MARHPDVAGRRQFIEAFKAGLVRMVIDEGETVGAVARDMDLTETGRPRLGQAARR